MRIVSVIHALLLLSEQGWAFLRHLQSKIHSLHPDQFQESALASKVSLAAEIGIGIDLGTTFSAVAYLKDDNTPSIIPIPENGRTVPSLVTIQEDKSVVVGKETSKCVGIDPFCNVKRIIGTGGKLSSDIQKVVPYLKASSLGKTFKKDNLMNQLEDAHEHPTLLVSPTNPHELIAPETIASHILQKLKHVAEDYTSATVTRAVIGVPASFNDAQREATKKAAEMAGITKVKLLREPEAAALAYGIGKQQITSALGDENDDDEELVLVFDLGGGTFDVSMLLVGGGLTEIISTSGNNHLGGSDFDARVADHFRKLLAKHGFSTKSWSEEGVASINRAAESTRIFLSNNKRAVLALPISEETWLQMSSSSNVLLNAKDDANSTETGTRNETHVLVAISRRTMEVLCKGELQALLRPVREVAIMSGALLPGDTSPTLLEAALELEELENENDSLAFQDFYTDGADKEDGQAGNTDTLPVRDELLLQLEAANLKAIKKAQQRGRKKARDVAKQERKYRQEKRKIAEKSDSRIAVDGAKVRDGIAGRPISRVVLVGGATRMPAVGRLVEALTGIVPQKTVNPDEAVALGCAVHVGVLDGAKDMGTVLNPMQAAILRAVAMKQGLGEDDKIDDEYDEEYEEVEYF